jgi:hypothetical protein
MNVTRKELEAAAERGAAAVLCGRLDLLDPVAAIIEALDAMDADCDLESGADFEDGADIERGGWDSGATPDQYRLTYDIGPDLKARSFGVLPPGVPGFERVTTSLPVREIERQRALVRRLEAGLIPSRAQIPPQKEAMQTVDRLSGVGDLWR